MRAWCPWCGREIASEDIEQVPGEEAKKRNTIEVQCGNPECLTETEIMTFA